MNIGKKADFITVDLYSCKYCKSNFIYEAFIFTNFLKFCIKRIHKLKMCEFFGIT